jgi:hypothetical protein
MFDAEAEEPIECVRLHVDRDGSVWYGHDSLFARKANESVSGFLRAPMESGLDLGRCRQLRLLGLRRNADLILGLHHERSLRGSKQPEIVLGNPLLVSSAAERQDARASLRQMWQPEPLAARGRLWHPFTAKEFPSYALASWSETGMKFDERCARTLQYHPAWPAISFCGRGHEAGCELVSQIVDPRWFQAAFRPNRLSSLLEYLGVTPENAELFLAGKPLGRNGGRFQALVEAWLLHPPMVGRTHPQRFLFRVMASKPSSGTRGLLAACRQYVKLVRDVWISEITNVGECRFVPERFFKNADEARAYVEHRASMKFV